MRQHSYKIMGNNSTLLDFLLPLSRLTIDLTSNMSLWEVNTKVNFQNLTINNLKGFNKFALLWGEAQLCLPYVCL